jgi:tRNA wybutosine-synthesizing protein 3
MIKNRDFIENKKQTLIKLQKEIEKKEVDEKIIPILELINSHNNYYTSSSCYGRIVLLEIPEIGDKKNAKWLGKWHREIELNEFLLASEKAKKGFLWLLAQSPIIHVFSNDLDSADNLIKIAVGCGFKHSSFKSFKKNIIIQIISTERLDAPIGKDGKFFCDNIFLDLLINISNNIIKRSSEKLKNFESKLETNL